MKSNILKPGDKVSCYYCMSREPVFVANNHGCFLKRVKSNCGTIMVDHASDHGRHFT